MTVGTGTVTVRARCGRRRRPPPVARTTIPRPVELGTRFTIRCQRLYHGDPFLQGCRRIPVPTVEISGLRPEPARQPSTFTGESAAGWQEAVLPSPVAITAGTLYVVSYHTSAGFYSGDDGYFATSGVDNGPLHAPRDGRRRRERRLPIRGGRVSQSDVQQRELLGRRRLRHIDGSGHHTANRCSHRQPGDGSSGVAANSAFPPHSTRTWRMSQQQRSNCETRRIHWCRLRVSYVAATRTATLPQRCARVLHPIHRTLKGESAASQTHAGNTLATDVHLVVHDGSATTSSAR